MRRLSALTFFGILIGLFGIIGCTQGNNGTDPGAGSSSLSLSNSKYESNFNNGTVTFSFSVPNGISAFQLVANANSLLVLTSLKNAAGTSLSIADGEIRNPVLSLPSVTNVPFASGEAFGGNYVATYSSPRATGSANLTVISKSDSTLTAGTVKINLILIGPVQGSKDVIDALPVALQDARKTFERASLLLDTQEYDFDGPSTVPSPGDSFYSNILKQVRPAAVNIVLGAQRSGNKSDENKYGQIGESPGAAIYDAASVIVISILDITGSDGKFNFYGSGSTQNSDDEVRLLGEEIARFTAEYLGLPPIVTLQGSRVVAEDGITDTLSCLSLNDCKLEKSIRTNLLFPVPVELFPEDRDPTNNQRQFYPRNLITAEQAAVLQRSVLVD